MSAELVAAVERTLGAASRVSIEVGGEQLGLRVLHLPRPGAPRVVLIHGNPSHLGHYARMISPLAARAEVLAFDSPGFGASDAPRGPLDLDFFADTTIALLDALGLEGPSDFIGQSHGGAVVQTILARHPSRARRGVALATMGYPAHALMQVALLPGIEALASFAASTLANPFLRPFGELVGHAEAWASFAPDPVPTALVQREIDRVAERPDIQRNSVRANLGDPTLQLHAQAPHIHAPLLFVHALHDHLVPIIHARNIYERIKPYSPESEFVTLAEGGHMAHLMSPDATLAAVMRWLAL